MSGTVNVAIVALVTLVLDVRRVNGDTASLLLRSLVDFRVVGEASGALLRENLRDSCRQRGLAMVDVACKEKISQLKAIRLHLSYVPMVPMFKWGFARENLDAAGSAYPRVKTGEQSDDYERFRIA